MAARKTATKTEKEIIDRLAHAFVCEEIGNGVFKRDYPEHADSYGEHMRKQCPEFYRLYDELAAAIPRVRKQFVKECEENKGAQS